MTENEESIFQKKSYEYAVGSVKATSHPLLPSDKLEELFKLNEKQAVRFLQDCEYGTSAACNSIEQKTQTEMIWVVNFLKNCAPDPKLLGAIFWREDAQNLKLLLKSKICGRNVSEFLSDTGYFALPVMKLCASYQDYSLLGKEMPPIHEVLSDTTDPYQLSCFIDRAFFLRAVNLAKSSSAIKQILMADALQTNQQTEQRIQKLGLDPKRYEYSLLPIEHTDRLSELCVEAVLDKHNLDVGIGPLAAYFIRKKREAQKIRSVFCRMKYSEDSDNEKDKIGSNWQ